MPADQPTRARESSNVVRLMPNVRQAAALVAPVSNAAITAASFSASTAAGRPPRRPRTARRSKAGLNALLEQRPFELYECTENAEQEFTLWRRCVHLLSERAEGDAAFS